MPREFTEKLARVHAFMEKHGYDGVLFSRNENFCWLSCGHRAFVDKGTESAVARLLITRDAQVALCNSSEMFRIPQEELAHLPFDVKSYRWDADFDAFFATLTPGMRIASDDGAAGTDCQKAALDTLRYKLTDDEMDRYREIGPLAARLVENCCRAIRPGQSERDIAAMVTAAVMAEGFEAPVCMAAADERLQKYRHPLPTQNKVQKVCLVAVCMQKYGLTISLSRIVHFGAVPPALQQRHRAVTQVDAAYILSTVPGKTAGQVVQAGKSAYEALGNGEDFALHHQGGGIGYPTRDYCATETDAHPILPCHAYAWNPTIAGTKSEDTLLVTERGTEILSTSGGWPQLTAEWAGQPVQRPDILVLPEE